MSTACSARSAVRRRHPALHEPWSTAFSSAGPAATPVWLRDLTAHFDLVWATTSEHKANRAVSPRLGLPQLPVIEFTSARTGHTWKLTDGGPFVGDSAVAWVDDELYADAYRWADERHAPTLLIRPQPSIGLVRAHVVELKAFGRAMNDEG